MSQICSQLDGKLLNERIVRSVANVVRKEIDEYLSEKLVDYNLYKDTYEQIMSVSVNKNTHREPSENVVLEIEELKREVEILRDELSSYRETTENVTLEIEEKDDYFGKTNLDVNPEDDDDESEEEIDDEEFKCEDCGSIQGKNNCELCDAEDVCEDCNGQGGDYGPNEIWVCNDCLPTCNGCDKKLYSAVDECCGKGRSDIKEEDEEEEDEEEEEVEVFEIEIKGKKYYTNDPIKKNGDVFAITPDDDIGEMIGKFKNGEFVLLTISSM